MAVAICLAGSPYFIVYYDTDPTPKILAIYVLPSCKASSQLHEFIWVLADHIYI